jgi:competence protein ComEC
MIITSFSPSIVRASFMFILILLNDTFKTKYSNIDILSIIFIISLLVNPFYYKNPGFILSFLVTLFLLLGSEILREFKGVNLVFLVGYVSFLSTIPLIMTMNYQINLFTLLFNILFILYMSYVILPLSYFTFVFPFYDKFLYTIIKPYNTLISMLSKIDYLIVNGTFISGLEIIIYYFLVITYFSFFNNSKVRKFTFSVGLVFLIIVLNSNTYNYKKSVNFLDVEGDATLIVDSFDKCNILIDTGEIDEFDSVINYLKSKNIKRIDYLIISHYHSDHYGEKNDIFDSFDVVDFIDPNNVNHYNRSPFSCGSLILEIYDLTLLNQNENNNSIVMSLYIEDKHYLFTGDSEVERELEFISKYKVDVDYLKVPHHGSSTSSSNLFLNSINPEEAFVMVYRYNKFDHPDYFVMQQYEMKNINVYRTDYLGTIEVEYYFNIERKKYNKP